VNCTVRNRFMARAARVGDMRMAVEIAIVVCVELRYGEERMRGRVRSRQELSVTIVASDTGNLIEAETEKLLSCF
jgi:hypothetical protein